MAPGMAFQSTNLMDNSSSYTPATISTSCSHIATHIYLDFNAKKKNKWKKTYDVREDAKIKAIQI